MRSISLIAAATLLSLPVAVHAAVEPCGSYSGGIESHDVVTHKVWPCSAQHPGLHYAVWSNGSWTLTVKRGTVVTQAVSSQQGAAQAGTLNNRIGDTITVTLDGTMWSYNLLDEMQVADAG